jgi:hypothetical protein
MFKGGCFCGLIRYEATGTPFNETTCHCSMCRRTTGAPIVTWFTMSRSGFRIIAGEPMRFDSSNRGTRSFCPRCGTQLTFENKHTPDEIDVTTCSLDDPDALPPKDHVYTSSKLRWVGLNDGLPEHREGRVDR